MDNQNHKSNVRLRQQHAPALQESNEAQSRLDSILLACFSVQKMYGRQPENIEIINQVFHNILGKYPAEKVIKAFEKWMERSQEFPTPADIVNLIKRNGRPPLSREIYIAISKKDAELRTSSDWQYLREYEGEADDDFGTDHSDEQKHSDFVADNQKLRSENTELRNEIGRLGELLNETRRLIPIEKPILSQEERVNNTLDYLKSVNASDEDIAAFIASQEAKAA